MTEQAPEQIVQETAVATEQQAQEIDGDGAEEFYQITINLPNKSGKVQVIVGATA
ncbi:hypothetical protein BGZ65_011781, partial [Modicella reniformis]